MNILVTSAHYHLSDKYGSDALLGVEIIKAYAAAGHRVYAVAGVSEISQTLPDNIRLYYLSSHRSSHPIIETFKKTIYPLFSFLVSLYVYLKEKNNIKLIHHIGPSSFVSYDLFFLAKPHGPIYLYGPVLPPPQENNGPLSFSRILGVPSSPLTSFLWSVVHSFYPILRLLAQATLRRADKIISVTSESQAYLKKLHLSSVVIPLGISHLPQISQRRSKNITILSVSYLVYRKGIDVLLRAFNILINRLQARDLRLIIAGSGEEMPILKQLTDQLQLDDYVKFTGFIDHSLIDSLYSKADIFCSPTRFEPFGMSVIEAMAHGLPVVVSRVNSLPQIVGSAGITFISEDPEDLARKLFTLVNDLSLRRTLGRTARLKVSKYFTWNKIVGSYLKLV